MKSKTSSRKAKTEIDLSIKIPEDYPWKLLDKITDDLRPYLAESDYELVKLIARNRDIAAYHILSEEWGLQSMNLNCGGCFEKSIRYILASLLKKYRFASDKNARELAAIVKYEAAELSCKTYNEGGFHALVAPGNDEVPVLFTYAREFLRKLLGETIPGHHVLTEWCRHGPGATLDTKKGCTSTYYKFAEWPYSCTLDAYRYARFAIETDQRWFTALKDSYRERKKIAPEVELDFKRFWSDVLKVSLVDRLAFVPKNSEIERIIAIGPTMNIYLQLGVDGFIRRRLKRFDVNLDDQKKNQRLARLGSLNDTEKSFVTLDLASASDTISTKLCELLLPPDWYKFLCDLRVPAGMFEERGLIYEYNKISAMGNGFTFALESAIFASVIFAVQKFMDGKISPKECAIYGDDLICRRYHSDKVIDLLHRFGFKLNLEKSFVKGPVRESCGTDWFEGQNVRPVFLDELPETAMDLFTDVNRLDRLLMLRVNVEEANVVKLIEKWIPEGLRAFQGPRSDELFDSYRHCTTPPGKYRRSVYKYRRLVAEPKAFGGQELQFRKLMHDLRPYDPLPLFYEGKWTKLVKSGSRFTVTRRGALRVNDKYSETSYWSSEYEEQQP